MKPASSRRDHRNVGLLQLISYIRRFPASAWVSLLHRVSGALLFLMLPFIVWVFDASVSSEISFARLTGAFHNGFGLLPGWLLRLAVLALLWAYLHHLIAGLRFLLLDINHRAVEKSRSARSAMWVLIVSIALTVVLGAKLFGLY